MREIKFRAYDKDTKIMVSNIWVAPDGSWADSLIQDKLKYSGKDCLMQFTGLKDKNGNRNLRR